MYVYVMLTPFHQFNHIIRHIHEP